MKEFVIAFAAVALSVFALTVVFLRILIPILRARKLGQKILEIGPRWHKNKEGTPIMGGIAFILAILISGAVFILIRGSEGRGKDFIPLAMTLGFAVANGGIGFIDDYRKLIKKQNEGLTVLQKLLLQLLIAGAYVAVMIGTGNLTTAVRLPFGEAVMELGYFAYPVYLILLVGIVNGANFTDGVDGLMSSVTFVIAGLFAVWAFYWKEENLAIESAMLLGATLGFLVYNAHPARIFMGDTGSLFFGGMVVATAFGQEEVSVALILCAVYIIEMLSSFLQVLYFKATHGKRLFLMAPIHHHFEKLGWGENKVVLVFSGAELVFCLLAWLALAF